MRRNKSAERDVEPDEGVATSREEGGVPNPEHPDQHTTTGTTPSEEFVGRVAGQDVGYAEETGAERRFEASRSDEES
ncbi:hypothetical protein GCM10027176_10860 [Actinoallomurus bryophytorum]|uniref:Uncharacterized protein n=1 Tax=Actinoallomurus bryophytorum TaxID=1490222 RepID=A0A543CQ15_9ACTN|nr:hypothetical protein [Actinoallomurus bryophytorum]TQL99196.1 hypothetical protein FB559_4853 [Actinoallomurus bryophytorum]